MLLKASDELWRSVRSFGRGERGAVVVAYGPSVSYDGPKLLTALAQRHPEIALATDVKPTAEILAAITEGSIDVGLVRCPPRTAELDLRTVRLEPLGVLVRRQHRLAAEPTVDLAHLAEETLLMHAREANPGHYDAVLALCRERGLEPRILLRALSFDPAQTPLVRGEAVAITGESSRVGLPRRACAGCLSVLPPGRRSDSSLRRYGRPPALDTLLAAATAVATEFGWLPSHADVS